MYRSMITRVLAVMTIGFAMFLAGCGGSKVNKDNFAKLKAGMTQQEVEAILGKGEVAASTAAALPGMSLSSKTEVWKDGNKSITVVFLNDKAQAITSKDL